MTPRKRWPNEAENAREESIAAARNGLRTAREMAKGQVGAQGLAQIVDEFHKIIENLMTVGPSLSPATGSGL